MKVIEAKKAARNPEPLRTVLFKFINEVNRYQSFYRNVAPMIRSVDYIGELERGKMGVLMFNVDHKDIPIIQNRFADNGFRVEWQVVA